ncbi:unnamed protein product, partial [Ectocarpus sp. 12 AP-2014]
PNKGTLSLPHAREWRAGEQPAHWNPISLDSLVLVERERCCRCRNAENLEGQKQTRPRRGWRVRRSRWRVLQARRGRRRIPPWRCIISCIFG